MTPTDENGAIARGDRDAAFDEGRTDPSEALLAADEVSVRSTSGGAR